MKLQFGAPLLQKKKRVYNIRLNNSFLGSELKKAGGRSSSEEEEGYQKIFPRKPRLHASSSPLPSKHRLFIIRNVNFNASYLALSAISSPDQRGL